MDPMYGDFSEPTDYHAAMQTISLANQQFELLPAIVRERFQNSPAKMLEFLADSNNKEEAIKDCIHRMNFRKPMFDIVKECE